MATDRRDSPRIACELEAKVLGPRGTLRGRVENLSTGGLLFRGKDLLPVGQSAEVEFTLGGQRIRTVGEVRHHLASDGGAAMGVRFLRLEPGALQAIQAFVDDPAGARLAPGEP